jgi:hypothetical protein
MLYIVSEMGNMKQLTPLMFVLILVIFLVIAAAILVVKPGIVTLGILAAISAVILLGLFFSTGNKR